MFNILILLYLVYDVNYVCLYIVCICVYMNCVGFFLKRCICVCSIYVFIVNYIVMVNDCIWKKNEMYRKG